MTDRMIFLIAFDLVLISAAISDARSLRIPNIFPIALLILFAIWTIWSGNFADLWRHGATFLIAIAAGALLFSLSFLGGGDVKIFAASALWFTPGHLPTMAFIITLAGALLTILFFFSKLFFAKSSPDAKWAIFRKRITIPYGIAIAAGSIFSIHTLGLA